MDIRELIEWRRKFAKVDGTPGLKRVGKEFKWEYHLEDKFKDYEIIDILRNPMTIEKYIKLFESEE